MGDQHIPVEDSEEAFRLLEQQAQNWQSFLSAIGLQENNLKLPLSIYADLAASAGFSDPVSREGWTHGTFLDDKAYKIMLSGHKGVIEFLTILPGQTVNRELLRPELERYYGDLEYIKSNFPDKQLTTVFDFTHRIGFSPDLAMESFGMKDLATHPAMGTRIILAKPSSTVGRSVVAVAAKATQKFARPGSVVVCERLDQIGEYI